MCFSTASGVTKSRDAIPRLERPSAIRRKTSISRSDKVAIALRQRIAVRGGADHLVTRRLQQHLQTLPEAHDTPSRRPWDVVFVLLRVGGGSDARTLRRPRLH